jgi:serine-type D-Ala-D-Ala endopeptidase (penicillin-binding protein 7)
MMRYLFFCLWLLATQAWGNSYALYRYDTNEYVTKQDVESIHSIASITKLFTAMTILESKSDLDARLRVECQNSGFVIRNTEMTRRDLLTAMIVSSDNCAAETLADNHPDGYHKFLADRNTLIQNLGLKNTRLYDATGLSVFNSSTVADLISFAPTAYADPVLRSVANLPQATVRAIRRGNEIVIKLHNTNPSVYNHKEVVISKTGFTNPAGRCVLMMTKKLENFYAVVVLGEPNVRARTQKVERLLEYENKTR